VDAVACMLKRLLHREVTTVDGLAGHLYLLECICAHGKRLVEVQSHPSLSYCGVKYQGAPIRSWVRMTQITLFVI
jgi:hypothetical protein